MFDFQWKGNIRCYSQTVSIYTQHSGSSITADLFARPIKQTRREQEKKERNSYKSPLYNFPLVTVTRDTAFAVLTFHVKAVTVKQTSGDENGFNKAPDESWVTSNVLVLLCRKTVKLSKWQNTFKKSHFLPAQKTLSMSNVFRILRRGLLVVIGQIPRLKSNRASNEIVLINYSLLCCFWRKKINIIWRNKLDMTGLS